MKTDIVPVKIFEKNNHDSLRAQYAEYLRSQLDADTIEGVESYWEWCTEELQVAKEYARRGTPLADYRI